MDIQEIDQKEDGKSIGSLNDEIVDNYNSKKLSDKDGIEIYIKFAIEIEDSGVGISEEN